MRAWSGIPCLCWCTHQTLSCLLHSFQEFLKGQLLLLNLHLRLLRDIGGNHSHTHTFLHRLSKDATHSKRVSGSEAGWRHRQSRAGEGSTFPGCKKCPCSSFCECQQPANRGRLGRRGRAVRDASCCGGGRKAHQDQQPESQQAQSLEGPPPARARYAGTPTAPHPS